LRALSWAISLVLRRQGEHPFTAPAIKLTPSIETGLPRSRSQKKKSAQALQSVGDELIERCDQYRRTVGCMRPELREAHPAIVGWSTPQSTLLSQTYQ